MVDGIGLAGAHLRVIAQKTRLIQRKGSVETKPPG
jgi:hypothetical protein